MLLGEVNGTTRAATLSTCLHKQVQMSNTESLRGAFVCLCLEGKATFFVFLLFILHFCQGSKCMTAGLFPPQIIAISVSCPFWSEMNIKCNYK